MKTSLIIQIAATVVLVAVLGAGLYLAFDSSETMVLQKESQKTRRTIGYIVSVVAALVVAGVWLAPMLMTKMSAKKDPRKLL